MKKNNKNRGRLISPEAVKTLESAKQHFLTAKREDILALNELIEFIKQVIEEYDNSPAVSSLSSLLTMIQLILDVIINKFLDPLRIGGMPADAGEILFSINKMVDEELSKLEKSDPSDPRLQVLWSIKEALSGKRKQKTKKKVRRINIE